MRVTSFLRHAQLQAQELSNAPQDQLTLVVSCFIWLLCKYWTEAKEFSLGTGSTHQHPAWGNPPALKLCLDPRVWEEGKVITLQQRLLILSFVTSEMSCWGCWQGSSGLLPYPLVGTWEGWAATGALRLYSAVCYKHITGLVEPLVDLFTSIYTLHRLLPWFLFLWTGFWSIIFLFNGFLLPRKNAESH